MNHRNGVIGERGGLPHVEARIARAIAVTRAQGGGPDIRKTCNCIDERIQK